MQFIENRLAYPDSYASIVQGIQNDQPEAGQALYQHIITALQRFMYSRLGPQDYRDAINDIYVDLVNAIRDGNIRNPDNIIRYAWKLAKGYISRYVKARLISRTQETPVEAVENTVHAAGKNQEAELIEREHADVIYSVLRTLSERERELMIRFYINKQVPKVIRQEMELTQDQYDHIKRRAIAKLTEKCKRSLS